MRKPPISHMDRDIQVFGRSHLCYGQKQRQRRGRPFIRRIAQSALGLRGCPSVTLPVKAACRAGQKHEAARSACGAERREIGILAIAGEPGKHLVKAEQEMQSGVAKDHVLSHPLGDPVQRGGIAHGTQIRELMPAFTRRKGAPKRRIGRHDREIIHIDTVLTENGQNVFGRLQQIGQLRVGLCTAQGGKPVAILRVFREVQGPQKQRHGGPFGDRHLPKRQICLR